MSRERVLAGFRPARLQLLGTTAHRPSGEPSRLVALDIASRRVPSDHPLIEHAVSRLEQQQEPDGRWPSEDRSARDVHTTLEAMRVLRLCHRI